MVPSKLVMGLLGLGVSVLADANLDKHVGTRINATSTFDPFEQLRIRATLRPSEPICCLIPLSSDPLPTTAEFLSFEEWKSKQLELQAQARSANQTPSPDTPPAEAPVGSSLMASSITLETEISLASPTETVPPLSPHFRVPLTDRFNYASLDCSARVHSSHPSARSPSAILSSKKDRYMLSPCSEIPNFVVVELCDDIRIDTVQLANFEFFSGVFRDFRVSVAQTYTTDGKGWIEAGTYRAKNIRGVQVRIPPSACIN
jgi:Sad1 / UNC-like C-terminal